MAGKFGMTVRGAARAPESLYPALLSPDFALRPDAAVIDVFPGTDLRLVFSFPDRD